MSSLDKQPSKQAKRLGFSFHRTFSLVRPALVQVLDLIEQGGLDAKRFLHNETIRTGSSLGSIYVEAMPRYARGAGLLDFKRQLTDFGHYTLAHDRLLEQSGTQWLMHYHLSAPHGPGPAFWHDLVVTFFQTGRVFARDDFVQRLDEFLRQTDGRTLAPRTVRSTATVFLGTYTKSDGLSKLGILTALEDERFRVEEPLPPPVWAAAYALLDYWAANYPGRLTISLDTLTAPGGFASLFLMGRQGFNEVLRALQTEHYVEVYRAAPPEQVVLLRQEKEPLLRKIYGTA